MNERKPFHFRHPEGQPPPETVIRADAISVKELMGKTFDLRNDPIGISNAPLFIAAQGAHMGILMGLDISKQKLMYLQRKGMGISQNEQNVDIHEGTDDKKQAWEHIYSRYQDIFTRPDALDIINKLSNRLLLPRSAQERITKDPQFPNEFMDWFRQIDMHEELLDVDTVADGIAQNTVPYIQAAIDRSVQRPQGRTRWYIPGYSTPSQFQREQEVKKSERRRLLEITQNPDSLLEFFTDSIPATEQQSIINKSLRKLDDPSRLEFVREYLKRTGTAIELITERGFLGYIMKDSDLIALGQEQDRAEITIEQERFSVKLDDRKQPYFAVIPHKNLPILIPFMSLSGEGQSINWENKPVDLPAKRMFVRDSQIVFKQRASQVNTYLALQIVDLIDRQEQAIKGRSIPPINSFLRQEEVLESTFIKKAVDHLKKTGKPELC